MAQRSSRTVVKSSDQTFSSATLADVTGLSFTVRADRYYHFRFALLVQSDTATVGVAVSVTTPASPTRLGATPRQIIGANGASAESQGSITSSGEAFRPTAVLAINTDYFATIDGILIPSADGTLQLQAATEIGTTNVIEQYPVRVQAEARPPS